VKTNTYSKIIIGLFMASYVNTYAQQTVTPGGNLWGYAFGDYAYVAHGDSAGRGNGNVQYKGLGSKASGTQNQNAFELRRVYLGYDYTINSKFSATTLLAYEGDYDVNGNRTIYLKNAYFTWKNIFKNSNLIIGQQFTPSFSTANNTDALWGYRSIERDLLDMRKIDASTDMGVSLAGKLWSADTSSSTSFIGYQVMVGDNTGNVPVPGFTASGTSQNTTTDKDKKFRFTAYYSGLNNKLTIGVYADFINYGNVYYKTSKGYQNATWTIKAYAAFNTKPFGIGAEIFRQANTNGEFEVNEINPKSNDTASAVQIGFSVFGHVTVIPGKLNIFARYDSYNPDIFYTHSSTETFTSRLVSTNTYTETFVTAGVDWTPVADKKVHLMPNIWYDGISNGYGSNDLKSDNYIVPRLTFLYIFK
jgi:hypothetical protein